jgi:putative FmdB family regulatory protein
MSIFEYRCKDCMTVSEYLIGVGNDESITCKKCGSLEMERIMSTPYYVTDFIRKNKKHIDELHIPLF